MNIDYHPSPAPFLDERETAEWTTIPVSIVGDELNRSQLMHAAIKPLAPGASFAGFACTVSTMVGDNLAGHYALTRIKPGEVLVIDARAYVDTAVWGEVMQTMAVQRRVAAIVIDGAVRDAAALRASTVPVYARAVVPAGPHKGFGGRINHPIQCAGVSVHSGDLVIGDDDGIVVVGPHQIDGLLERCRERLRNEETMFEAIRAGASTVELMGLPPLDESPERSG